VFLINIVMTLTAFKQKFHNVVGLGIDFQSNVGTDHFARIRNQYLVFEISIF